MVICVMDCSGAPLLAPLADTLLHADLALRFGG